MRAHRPDASSSLLLALLLIAPACRSAPTEPVAPEVLAQEASVKPGINERWKSDEIGPLIGILEAESREIFTERGAIAAIVGPRPGAAIADVGAGSGFMTHLFSRIVGDTGTVYAVDINATMLGHVAEGAAEHGLTNIETVVCTERSVELPAESVDIVFVCDTYHHFEYPQNTLRSIHEALRPNGQLVVVDFYRIPGTTPQWLLDHVRAGRDVFRSEIEAAGFRFTNQHDFEGLTENYILRFQKDAGGAGQ